MARPDLSRVPEYYHRYISQVPEDNLMTAFKNQGPAFMSFLERIPVMKREFRYAEGKWTLFEMLQHILDAERIFSYRALCFARGDSTPLPGFDENNYAAHSKAGKRKWEELVEEFKTVRRATEILYGSFDAEQLDASGNASGNSTYVLGIGFIIAGHVYHHMKVIKEKYLKGAVTTG